MTPAVHGGSVFFLMVQILVKIPYIRLIAKIQVVGAEMFWIKYASEAGVLDVSSAGSYYLLQSEALSSSLEIVEEFGYDILTELGSGAFGTVFEAAQHKILKVVNLSVPTNRNELRMVKKFKHENVMTVGSSFFARLLSRAKFLANKCVL